MDLAIPLFVVLIFLWVAFAVLTVIAFFAVLFTGRYPRGSSTSTSACCAGRGASTSTPSVLWVTDRYPPFTLRDVPEFPARLEIAYPESLRRVPPARWLVAARHPAVLHREHPRRGRLEPRFIGILVFVAGVLMLFKDRYPQDIFDLVLGLNRWVLRVVAYAAFMTREYPPFRLDMVRTSRTSKSSRGTSHEVAAGAARGRKPEEEFEMTTMRRRTGSTSSSRFRRPRA